MTSPRALAVAAVVVVAALGCSEGPRPITKRAFAEQADAICLATSARFEAELPETVGGAKPVGLGGFMREWITDLRTLTPPPTVAADWSAGLRLLERTTFALDAAERGDPEAQGEALWVLQARAQKRFDAMGVPFRVCFVE